MNNPIETELTVRKITISVAIATFNGETFIEQLIASIVSQTLKPDELIISDDCSSDSTVMRAKKLLHSCNINYRIYENSHRLGFENNFMRSIRLCQGDLVFLADQDDLWMPNKLFLVHNVALRMPYHHVFLHDAYVCNDKLCIINASLFNSKNSSTERYAYGFCMAIRRDLLQLFPEKIIPIGHDLIINQFANCLGAKFFIYDKLAIYRRHESAYTYNASANKSHCLRIPPFFDSHSHQKAIAASATVLDMVAKALSSPGQCYTPNKPYINRLAKTKLEHETRLNYMAKPWVLRLFSIIYSFIKGSIPLPRALKDSISVNPSI